MKTNNKNKALRLVQWLSDQAIDGVRPLSSARDLADEYLLIAPLGVDSGHKNVGHRLECFKHSSCRAASELTIGTAPPFFAYHGPPPGLL